MLRALVRELMGVSSLDLLSPSLCSEPPGEDWARMGEGQSRDVALGTQARPGRE